MLKWSILILVLVSGIAAQCQDGFRDVRGSCYKFIIRPNSTYAQAQAHCRSLGPNVNLATIRCDAENAAVFKMMHGHQQYVDMVKNLKSRQPYKNYQHWLNAWIGLHDLSPKKAKTGIWYSDNTCNLYRRFAPGEPNNYGNNNEGCIEFMYYHSRRSAISRWNDMNCGAQMLSMVCEQQTKRSGGACKLKPCADTVVKPENPKKVQRDLTVREGTSGRLARGNCLSGFTNAGGSCYKFVIRPNSTYAQAQAHCRSLGPNVNLATIRCDVENAAVFKMMHGNQQYVKMVKNLKSRQPYTRHQNWLNAWIGLHNVKPKQANTGIWFSDNTCNLYRRFAPGEPNNIRNSNKSCVELIYNSVVKTIISKWNDLSCNSQMLSMVCEQQMETSGGLCNLEPCSDTQIKPQPGRDLSALPARPQNPLPVPISALQKTVEVKAQGGFYQQYFTFNAREFLSALIEYVTKTTEKCQDLRCRELRAKEAKGKL